MIHTLVPLTMYVVRYEVAHGRPYSKLEELLLKAINLPGPDGGHTFDDLREVFQVHDRLLTEGLVTLIQEGWIAMEQPGAEIQYLVTEEGRKTISSGRRPSNLRVRTKHASIVRERLTGQLARANDLTILTAKELRGSVLNPRKVRSEALTPRVMRTEINGGETERLLPRSDERQEWVRWIDSVSRVSQDLHYLPVRVDLGSGRVLGLPYQWQHLSLPILEEVALRSEEMLDDVQFQEEVRRLMQERAVRAARRQEASEDRDPFATVAATCADVAITARESASLIEDVLRKCTDHAFLAVANLDRRRAAAVRDTVIRLLTAGVKVDLLWSSDGTEEAPREIYNVLSAARAKALRGPQPMLVLNAEPAGIAVDLLLAQTSDGPVAVAGSAFAEPEPEPEPEPGPEFEPETSQNRDQGLGHRVNSLAVSVRITARPVLAALARLSAGWWETVEADQAMLAAHRWKHYGERWSDEGARPASPAPESVGAECPYHHDRECTGEVAIVTGVQQEIMRAELIAEEGRRFLLTDGRMPTDELLAAFTEACGERTGYLYQAFGGSDGWYFLRRQEPGTWTDYRRPDFIPPSPTQRVTGSAQRWLVSSNSADQEPALSFQLSGHIAVMAWERTASAQPQGQPSATTDPSPSSSAPVTVAPAGTRSMS
jgi:hypothetical protein